MGVRRAMAALLLTTIAVLHSQQMSLDKVYREAVVFLNPGTISLPETQTSAGLGDASIAVPELRQLLEAFAAESILRGNPPSNS
jgi:hypothetical protein